MLSAVIKPQSQRNLNVPLLPCQHDMTIALLLVHFIVKIWKFIVSACLSVTALNDVFAYLEYLIRKVLCFLCFSGVLWCRRWSGACLCATTTPEVSAGRTASAAVRGSYGPSWPTVTSLLNCCQAEYEPALSKPARSQASGLRWGCGWWAGCTASPCGCTLSSVASWTCLWGSRLAGRCCWSRGACWRCQQRYS